LKLASEPIPNPQFLIPGLSQLINQSANQRNHIAFGTK